MCPFHRDYINNSVFTLTDYRFVERIGGENLFKDIHNRGCLDLFSKLLDIRYKYLDLKRIFRQSNHTLKSQGKFFEQLD